HRVSVRTTRGAPIHNRIAHEKIVLTLPDAPAARERLRDALHHDARQRLANHDERQTQVEKRNLLFQGYPGPGHHHFQGTRGGDRAGLHGEGTKGAVQSPVEVTNFSTYLPSKSASRFTQLPTWRSRKVVISSV